MHSYKRINNICLNHGPLCGDAHVEPSAESGSLGFAAAVDAHQQTKCDTSLLVRESQKAELNQLKIPCYILHQHN